MRFSVVAILLAAVWPFSTGLAAEENPAYGVWLTDNGKSKVHVSECDGGLCSQIMWLRKSLDSEGNPLTDEYNPNPEQRGRPIIGIKVLDGLTQTDSHEWEGEVYNPEDGKTYKAYLSLIKPDVIRLKGCMPMGWPCRSKFWKKLKEEPPGQPAAIMAGAGGAQGPSLGVKVADGGGSMGVSGEQVTTQSLAEQTVDGPPQAQPSELPAAMAPQQLTPPAAIGRAEQAQRPKKIAPQPRIAQPQTPVEIAQLPDPLPQVAAPKTLRSVEPLGHAPPPPPPSLPPQPRDASGWETSQIPAEPEVKAVPAPSQAPPSQVWRQAVVIPPPPPPPPPPFGRVGPSPPPRAAEPGMRRLEEVGGGRFAALEPDYQRDRGNDGGAYLVQVAARQSEKEAMAVFYGLRQNNPQLLGDVRPIIKRVDLGDLGVWYRVRVGPITGKAAALAFCSRLKFAGSDCFIRRQ